MGPDFQLTFKPLKLLIRADHANLKIKQIHYNPMIQAFLEKKKKVAKSTQKKFYKRKESRKIYSSSSSSSSSSFFPESLQDEIITNTPTKTPYPDTNEKGRKEKKKGKTSRNEEKTKTHIENEAPGKKQEKR